MKQLLNIIILLMVGGAVGACVQMAINPPVSANLPGIKLYPVKVQQQELVDRGHDIKVDGKFGPNTDLALFIEISKKEQ